MYVFGVGRAGAGAQLLLKQRRNWASRGFSPVSVCPGNTTRTEQKPLVQRARAREAGPRVRRWADRRPGQAGMGRTIAATRGGGGAAVSPNGLAYTHCMDSGGWQKGSGCLSHTLWRSGWPPT